MGHSVVDLMSQKVFSMTVADVLVTLREKNIPQHEIALSNGDVPLASVMFFLDADTIQAVKTFLSEYEAKGGRDG